MDTLRAWLNDQTENRHLSWREASINAGLNPGAISAIMNGQRPGLEVCKALADYFNTPPEHVLRLAGHLPPKPPTTSPRVEQLIDRLMRLPADSQQRIVDAALYLIEFDEAARGQTDANHGTPAEVNATSTGLH